MRVAQFPADVPDQLRRLPAVPPPRRDGQTQEAGDLPVNALHPARCLLRSQQPQEFGLTQDEIYDAIDAGTLQYRQAYMHGNPWLRLLRREVEALARTRHGDRYVSEQQARAELTRVNREIRRLRTELAELEERRAKLSSDLAEWIAPASCAATSGSWRS